MIVFWFWQGYTWAPKPKYRYTIWTRAIGPEAGTRQRRICGGRKARQRNEHAVRPHKR